MPQQICAWEMNNQNSYYGIVVRDMIAYQIGEVSQNNCEQGVLAQLIVQWVKIIIMRHECLPNSHMNEHCQGLMKAAWQMIVIKRRPRWPRRSLLAGQDR